ncbi:MAG: prevent-host-death protein [Armatimonadetes bacterium RBG_16_67_12]|nr:MAG: prevent-host-death protein [Armatimonadetes bacterium RBG_16_67_12]
MAIETTYTKARASLARLCDLAALDRETIIITRRGAPRVALIAADELSSLMETAHLLRSPRNAQRLLRALRRALRGKGTRGSVAALRRELSLPERR